MIYITSSGPPYSTFASRIIYEWASHLLSAAISFKVYGVRVCASLCLVKVDNGFEFGCCGYIYVLQHRHCVLSMRIMLLLFCSSSFFLALFEPCYRYRRNPNRFTCLSVCECVQAHNASQTHNTYNSILISNADGHNMLQTNKPTSKHIHTWKRDRESER